MSARQDVSIPAGTARLGAFLTVPEGATGIVLFAHGSGSGRLSPRNGRVAGELQRAGIATLLADLLTDEEAADRRAVFDIPLLSDRLATCHAYVAERNDTRHLPVGYFGASTGAAAALVTAARSDVVAVVSRGGRPDLVGEALGHVRCPTLLIVGGHDTPVIALNQRALEEMHCPSRMVIVPGATHLFEEPGALEEVARIAAEWFAGAFGPST